MKKLKRQLVKNGHRVLFFLTLLGPGIITASADNDAPGIATYSMAGSKYGYQFLWLLLVVTLGEVVIQETAARMGGVTGKGTADLIRERFGVRITTFAMVCLLLANTGTTVAQFAGIGASMELLGVSRYVAVPLAALLVGFVVLRGSYDYVEKILLILSLASLSYVITAVTLNPPWGQILREAVTPSLRPDPEYIMAVLATIGTTITPWGIVYMQASVADKGVTMQAYRYTRLDVVFGAAWGNVVSAFIVICTAATLFIHGIIVDSAADAAMALGPLAGDAARYLFSAGLLGASLLAASVLPLSTTYAVCEAFGWERGLNQRSEDAPIFYGLYVGVLLISVLIVLVPGIPLFPLMWLSQTLNALLLPVLLLLVLKLANDEQIMGKWRNSRLQNALTWGLTVLITVVALLLLASVFLSDVPAALTSTSGPYPSSRGTANSLRRPALHRAAAPLVDFISTTSQARCLGGFSFGRSNPITCARWIAQIHPSCCHVGNDATWASPAPTFGVLEKGSAREKHRVPLKHFFQCSHVSAFDKSPMFDAIALLLYT